MVDALVWESSRTEEGYVLSDNEGVDGVYDWSWSAPLVLA